MFTAKTERIDRDKVLKEKLYNTIRIGKWLLIISNN
jgi:hypothetical protein